MSDFHPQVVAIEKIEKHENADTLSIYTVLNDYQVVDKTGKFQVGDLASYIPVDAVVPDTSDWNFLSPKKYERYEEDGEIKQKVVGPKYEVGLVPERYRIIKAKKFFGAFSQGILTTALPGLEAGADITEAFGLKKWEEQDGDELPTPKIRGANQASPPKGWSIPYYDIENVRKYLSCVENEQDVILSEKLHGEQASFCHDGIELWVKSRNYYKRRDENDSWWEVAMRYDLETKLAKFPGLVFFAEHIAKVKGFRYGAELSNGKLMTKLRFFDIWDTKALRYLDYDDMVAKVNEVGLKTAPQLYRGKWLSKEEMYAYADGMTTLGGKHMKEGFVVSLGKERYEPRLDSRLKLKFISPAYLLQK